MPRFGRAVCTGCTVGNWVRAGDLSRTKKKEASKGQRVKGSSSQRPKVITDTMKPEGESYRISQSHPLAITKSVCPPRAPI